MGPIREPEGAVTIFVLGLLGLLMCQVLGVIAWIQGNEYKQRCRELGVRPDSLTEAGWVLGIIATLILVGALLLTMLAVIVGVFASL